MKERISSASRSERLRALRRFSAMGVGLLAVLLLMGTLVDRAFVSSKSSPEPAGGDPAAVVGMTDALDFEPETVTIPAGETVRWENTSFVVHTVTADPAEATQDGSVQLPEGAEPFDSGTLETDETFEYTFEEPGTYRYFCIPHEAAEMQGTVVVEPRE